MSRKTFAVHSLALLIAFCSSAIASQSDNLDIWCYAQISLDAGGKVTALEFIGKKGNADPIAQKLTPLIRTWSFAPATINGVPTQSETTLSLHLKTEKTGDGAYALRILDAHTGATPRLIAYPEYPRQELLSDTEASVVAFVSVDAQGVPANVEIASIRTTNGNDRATTQDFEKAVIKAAKSFRFLPESVGGQSVTSKFRIPMQFCMSAHPCLLSTTEQITGDQALSTNRPVALDSQVKLLTQVAGTTL